MARQTDSEKILPILIPVLGKELALAIIEHRDKVKKEPLTEYAAKLQVKEYLKCGDPVAAAEMQILRGWRSIRCDWFLNETRKAGLSIPSRPSTPFQQRHQDAINAFDHALGREHEQSTSYDIQLDAADFRTH